MATQGICFAGKPTVRQGDALLTLGIQFAAQQLGLQLLDDCREGLFQPVYCLFCPLAYQ